MSFVSYWPGFEVISVGFRKTVDSIVLNLSVLFFETFSDFAFVDIFPGFLIM